MHEDKYLVLFLMKCGFSGVQHKQHENNFFLTLKAFGFCLLLIFFSLAYTYILVRGQLLSPKEKNLTGKDK